jgi:hypothetical protein
LTVGLDEFNIALLVQATSVANPSKTDSVIVTINDFTITPLNPSILKGDVLSFKAKIGNTDEPNVRWEVNGTASTISADGVLSVGTSETYTTLTVKATSIANPQTTGSTTVTVLSSDVRISPASSSVEQGGKQTFTAVVEGETDNSVTWSVSYLNSAAGNLVDTFIDDKGVLTVGAREQVRTQLLIKATSVANPSKAGVTTVTVIASTKSGIT